MSQAASAATEKTAAKGTEYVVLKLLAQGRDELPPTYQLVGRDIRASSSEHAIRLFTERAETSEASKGLFVAIPSRSWKPIRVTTSTKTVVTLENA